MTKRRVHAEPRRYWTPAEEAMVRGQYPHMKTEVIARMLERTTSTVYQRAQKLGLRKSDEFYALPASGRPCGRQGIGTRFVKGQIPANKGVKRGRGWAPGRMAETQFKPGVRQGVAVKLYKPIGTERISKDGYLERKVNDDLPLQRRWRAVHLIVWEAVHGPVNSRTHAVVFRNKDRTDIRLENLELVTRKELLARNWHRRYPKQIRQLVQLRGAITRQINKRTRK
jgi:hypothetical protein